MLSSQRPPKSFKVKWISGKLNERLFWFELILIFTKKVVFEAEQLVMCERTWFHFWLKCFSCFSVQFFSSTLVQKHSIFYSWFSSVQSCKWSPFLKRNMKDFLCEVWDNFSCQKIFFFFHDFLFLFCTLKAVIVVVNETFWEYNEKQKNV